MANAMAPEGWYPDVQVPNTLRWWDGQQWTQHTAPAEASTIQPSATPQTTQPSPSIPVQPAQPTAQPLDPQSRGGDLSYRFRIHGAMFIADRLPERRDLFRELRNLYGIRSRIVHGDQYPTGSEALSASQVARRLAARGLVKALREGFPNAAKFNKLVVADQLPS